MLFSGGGDHELIAARSGGTLAAYSERDEKRIPVRRLAVSGSSRARARILRRRLRAERDDGESTAIGELLQPSRVGLSVRRGRDPPERIDPVGEHRCPVEI